MTAVHEGFAVDEGRAQFHGTAAALCRWFDGQFLRMAREAGAEECRFPATIARACLDRAGFFEAFPGGATALDAPAAQADYFLAPAACYHVYAWLSGKRLVEPLTATLAQSCFRPADRGAGSPERLWEFTMREVVFVGPAAWVAARRDEWAERVQQFAVSLGLRGSLEPAADPFFGPAGRGRRLLQQLKELKYELGLDLGDGRTAVASFNLHERFFGQRFAIDLDESTGRDGLETVPASSACAAFGLERWALAYLGQRGAAAARALINQ